jgi:hypothetical protein
MTVDRLAAMEAGSLLTRRTRSSILRWMGALGHEERFPPTRLSAGCGFRKETIAGVRRNGRDAPTPAIRGIATAPPRFDRGCVKSHCPEENQQSYCA